MYPINVTPYIQEIGRGSKGARNLSKTDAEILFGAILDNQVDELELGALLLGLRIKGESIEELQGFKAALDARTPQFTVQNNNQSLVVIPSYNGARRQINLMPLVALLLVRAGLPVILHGRYDFETRTDPSDLMSKLGIPHASSKEEAETLLGKQGIVFINLEKMVPQLNRLLALRQRMGLRNSGHTMAKLVDPCRGKSIRIVAVTHPGYLDKMREFLKNDGGRSLLMRGTEGEAYANPKRRPMLEIFTDGVHEVAYPAETGGAPPLDYLPNTTQTDLNQKIIEAILSGKLPIPQPILDQVACCRRLVTL